MIYGKNDKLILINAASDSIDELMEGLDVDSSNDIAVEKLKDFKSILIKSVNKFNSYIKLDTKKKDIEKKDIEKKDIEKKGIKKKDTVKEHIEKINTKKIASNMMLIINLVLVLTLGHI